ncbi:IS5 family transposase [Brucella pituitosa]|uniref:IS5 family transposase n=1 Tax=Brucella pituitosa TaxID=571256 RepID=UPI003F4AADB5
MPFKHNCAHRHRMPKQKFKVTNWAEYESGLCQRGSVTFWISEAAIAGWIAPSRKTRGGQRRYCDLAIETTPICGKVFNQLLRQTEGLMASLLTLLNVELPVPDHTTLSRRCADLEVSSLIRCTRIDGTDGPLHVIVDSTGMKIYGAGQWLEEKHGAKSARKWRKLHFAIDADSNQVIAETLTDQNTIDLSQGPDLLGMIDHPIASFMADGAYDSDKTYQAFRSHSPGVSIIIPPRMRNLQEALYGPPDQRDWHSRTIGQLGRMAWQNLTGYGKRARVENAIGNYKSTNGSTLRLRNFANQKTEVKIGCGVRNRMLQTPRPKSVRVKVETT